LIIKETDEKKANRGREVKSQMQRGELIKSN
jgi:hypothetical protein